MSCSRLRAECGHGADGYGAVCALRARGESEPRLCFQLLVYPAGDSRMETGSMRKYADSPMWNAGLI